MSNYAEPELTGRTTRSPWPIVIVGVLALLVGGGAGYAARALTTEPPAPVVVAAPPAPAPAPPAPAGCVAATEAAAALTEQLQRGVPAIQNLDPGTLRSVLDQVQRLQRQLEDAVRGCSGSLSPSPPIPGG